ncbi:hypothetical protein BUALT_Bualt01G0046800 [Buddleja alternifolia]|uniref:SHSP domain-containing protein n=1 Tax=Buddleja alternifolia TaxID=168488 RepID=A0AAV6YF04_9LAMI|nr:hypothetical protein BUALT_Bualt01G0046800 [Buddleja alternifolia]
MVHKIITGTGLYVFVDPSSASRRICAVVLEDEESLRLSRSLFEGSAAGGGGTCSRVLTSPAPVRESLVPSGDVILESRRVDWKETPKRHVFEVDVPGFKIEEVKVDVIKIKDDAILRIQGESRGRGEKDGENSEWHLMERGGDGKFSRRFELPEGALLDQVSFDMEDGVLTVVVPKEEVKMFLFPPLLFAFTTGSRTLDADHHEGAAQPSSTDFDCKSACVTVQITGKDEVFSRILAAQTRQFALFRWRIFVGDLRDKVDVAKRRCYHQ